MRSPLVNVPYPVYVYPIPMQGRQLDVAVPQVWGIGEAVIRMNQILSEDARELVREQGWPDNPETDSQGAYEIKTNQRNVLSLWQINYAFSGGAHGLTLYKSRTFNTQTGKDYSLSELFKPDSNYVEKLSDLVDIQIKEREIPILDPPFKGISREQPYYIADKALILYFPVYDLAPYVYGVVYFPISIYDIEDLIAEDSPLSAMFG